MTSALRFLCLSLIGLTLSDGSAGPSWAAASPRAKVSHRANNQSINWEEALIRLTHVDPAIRRTAALQLGQAKRIETLPALQRAAEDSDTSVRVAALDALGNLIDPDTLPVLGRALQNKNPAIRQAAAKGIAILDHPTTLTYLFTALNDEDIIVREFAVRGLTPAISLETKLNPVWTRVEPVLSTMGDESRRAFAEACGSLQDDRLAQWLRKSARDDTAPDVRRQSAVSLTAHLSEDTVRVLAEVAAGDSQFMVQDAALTSLARLGPSAASAAPTLLTLLDPLKKSNFSKITYALGQMKDLRAVPVLTRLVTHPDNFIRHEAVSALGQIDSPSALEGLALAFEDRDPQTATTAVLLAGMRGPAAIPYLPKALAHRESRVRLEAVGCAHRIGDPSAIPFLTPLVNDADPKIREAVRRALETLKTAPVHDPETDLPGFQKRR